MKLSIDRLEKPRERGGKIIARCPACAEIGKDTACDNLAIMRPGEEGEHFACAAYLSDKEHARRIIELAGDKSQMKPNYIAPIYRPMKPKESPLPRLTPRQVQIMLSSIERLGKSDTLCASIAARRGWKPETIRHAAQDMSMGWIAFDADVRKPDRDCPNSAPCFIYRAGLKVRFIGKDGKKTFRFLKTEGLNHKSIWRSELITQETKTVWLTEGEPDALRLMDLGMGELGGNSEVVCALPDSGYTIRHDEIELLRGREIIFVPDTDKAGRESEKKLSQLFQAAGIQFSKVTL